MTGIFEYAASNGAVVGWAIAFVVFLIVEGVTLNALVSIWFAAASLLAMFAAIAGLALGSTFLSRISREMEFCLMVLWLAVWVFF